MSEDNISEGIRKEVETVDNEVAGLAIASISSLAAFTLIPLARVFRTIDSTGEIVALTFLMFAVANVLNYFAVQRMIKPDRIDPAIKKKVRSLGMVVTTVMSVVVGIFMFETI